MNEEITNLAKECGLGDITVHGRLETKEEAIEAFYKAAFNAGLEAAADKAWEYHKHGPEAVDDAIHALKEKV